MTTPCTNYDAYYTMSPLALYGEQTIRTCDITSDNWRQYADGLLNIMRDSIETDWMHNAKINVIFRDTSIVLTVPDMFFNVVFWGMIVSTGREIEPKHIFFPDNLTTKYIKKWIDKNFINVNRGVIDSIMINNIIDNSLFYFTKVSDFEMYLSNTICLEDFVELQKKDKVFYDALHHDFSDVPLENVEDEGMRITNIAIDHLINADKLLGHEFCLAGSFETGEGTNPRQFKDVFVNIGTKPDGRGNIFPYRINSSFVNGGLQKPYDFYVQSSGGRLAQIINRENIGKSGHLARIMGYNNSGTILHPDPNYDCGTRNFEIITIVSEKMLEFYHDRWYRLRPDGVERIINDEDYFLIGKTIYLRSPMTCASHAKGYGICYKCFGKLAYTLQHINIGKGAAENITSVLTQNLLSAKHLLKPSAIKTEWIGDINSWINIDGNRLTLVESDYKKNQFLAIYNSDIVIENDDEYAQSMMSMSEKNEDYMEDSSSFDNSVIQYITRFTIVDGAHKEYDITTKDKSRLFITNEFLEIMKEYSCQVDDDRVIIPLSVLEGINMFCMEIQNNELNRSLINMSNIINKKDVTSRMTKDQILQAIIETQIECGLNISSVHYEIILSNQIRSKDDISERPDWTYENENYTILTLDKALTTNPSVVISMLYQRIKSMFVSPQTYKKTSTSEYDPWLKEYVNRFEEVDYDKKKPKVYSPVEYIDENELNKEDVK